jgi:hypothetical protein
MIQAEELEVTPLEEILEEDDIDALVAAMFGRCRG